jgi:hypothetical protein
MPERPVVIRDNAMRRTSAWADTLLGRDHATKPPIDPADQESRAGQWQTLDAGR